MKGIEELRDLQLALPPIIRTVLSLERWLARAPEELPQDAARHVAQFG